MFARSKFQENLKITQYSWDYNTLKTIATTDIIIVMFCLFFCIIMRWRQLAIIYNHNQLIAVALPRHCFFLFLLLVCNTKRTEHNRFPNQFLRNSDARGNLDHAGELLPDSLGLEAEENMTKYYSLKSCNSFHTVHQCFLLTRCFFWRQHFAFVARAPNSNGSIIGRCRQHVLQLRIPVNTVDSARVAFQDGDWLLSQLVPDVCLVIWIKHNHISTAMKPRNLSWCTTFAARGDEVLIDASETRVDCPVALRNSAILAHQTLVFQIP